MAYDINDIKKAEEESEMTRIEAILGKLGFIVRKVGVLGKDEVVPVYSLENKSTGEAIQVKYSIDDLKVKVAEIASTHYSEVLPKYDSMGQEIDGAGNAKCVFNYVDENILFGGEKGMGKKQKGLLEEAIEIKIARDKEIE